MADKSDYRQILTDKLIEQLEAGTAPWQKPWDAREGGDRLPYNPVTGKEYRGANSLYLTMNGRSDPRWATYKQAAEQGWQVRKGEKGALIEYWKFSDTIPAVDSAGKPVMGEDGKQKTVSVLLDKPKVFRAVVFNAEQMDGVPEISKGPRQYEWDPLEKADGILKSSGAKLFHDQADRAFYSPAKDEIHLPGRDQFKSPAAYYSTALHELGHWTGHETRLKREFGGGFGSADYAKEELRAELSSYFMADKLGIPHDPGQHAAYVKSWIQVLQEDKNEIFRAARDAEKITDYVLAIGQEQNLEVNNEHGVGSDAKQQSKGQYSQQRTVLAVPFKDKDEAKNRGAKWDKDSKVWYAPSDANLENLNKWLVKPEVVSPPSQNPEEEFAAALRENGLVLDGLPIMDGKIHRVPVEGKGPRSKDGAYVGYLDGNPSGFIQNFSAGTKSTWTLSGNTLTPEERAQMQAHVQLMKEQREAELAALNASVADKCVERWQRLQTVGLDGSGNEYLKRKGVLAVNVRQDGEKLVVPLRDIDGKLWSLQMVSNKEGSAKIFEKGGLKKGNFSVFSLDEKAIDNGQPSNFDALAAHKPTQPILVAEGYATGATVGEATKETVVVAFDSGNIDPVVESLKSRFPMAPIFICADHDRQLKDNVGVEKAWEAAEKHQVGIVIPEFSGGQSGTDFNDLAAGNGSGGKSVVAAQIKPHLQGTMRQSREVAAAKLGLSMVPAKVSSKSVSKDRGLDR